MQLTGRKQGFIKKICTAHANDTYVQRGGGSVEESLQRFKKKTLVLFKLFKFHFPLCKWLF